MNVCQLDEENALAFLKAAASVIADAGISPPSLDLLDSLAGNPNAYGLGGRADLAALVAQWSGPYESPGVGAGESPKTMRECVLACLEADDAGNMDFGFRTYASNDSGHWYLEETPLKGVPVFGLYLIREDEASYICSLTPSSRADFLQNVFAYPDQSDAPKVNGYGQSAIEVYMDGEGAELAYQNDAATEYFGYFGDRAALDRRQAEKGDVSERIAVSVSVLEVDLSALNAHAASPVDPGASDAFSDWPTCQAAFYKTAAETAWENAREYVQGNAVEPDCIWRSIQESA